MCLFSSVVVVVVGGGGGGGGGSGGAGGRHNISCLGYRVTNQVRHLGFVPSGLYCNLTTVCHRLPSSDK
jgi:hypothetical protein